MVQSKVHGGPLNVKSITEYRRQKKLDSNFQKANGALFSRHGFRGTWRNTQEHTETRRDTEGHGGTRRNKVEHGGTRRNTGEHGGTRWAVFP